MYIYIYIYIYNSEHGMCFYNTFYLGFYFVESYMLCSDSVYVSQRADPGGVDEVASHPPLVHPLHYFLICNGLDLQ